jgi:hypothetical protein
VSDEILIAGLVAAGHNPGPAAHVALLGAIVAIGLVVLAFTRWRRRREEQIEEEPPTEGHSVTKEPRAEETDRAREHDPTSR